MKRILPVIIVLFAVQTAFANYAFYKKVTSVCTQYRIKTSQADMSLSSDVFEFNLESLRNNFEMVMLVGFAATGQAINHQYSMAEHRSDYSPLVPQRVIIAVQVPVERDQMIITATASATEVRQLANGEIKPREFMQSIKDSIQTL